MKKPGGQNKARYDSLGLPDDEFDHDDFVRREFEPDRLMPRGIRWFWWLIAVGVVVAFVAFILGIR